MIRVLADYHHACLYESLALLFEDRFGWELYRPIGMEWYDSDLWRFERAWHGDAVARQYLSPWPDDMPADGHSLRAEPQHPGRTHRLVTMDQAADAGIDLVLSTLTENEPGWHAWAMAHGAHYGIQVGNQGAQNEWGLAEFAMCSSTVPLTPWMPHVFYHQEFSLADYRPARTGTDLVGTWVQCLTSDGAEAARFRRLASLVPEGRFRYHGHCSDDDDPLYGGNVATCPEVAEQMRSARVGLHLKTWSDGYGHVIHDLFAVGRPVVATASYYRDKLAAPLFIDGETSFDVQTRTDGEVAGIIRRLLLDDDFAARIGENAARRFREVVDFETDAQAVRAMLEGVLSDRLVTAA